MSDFGAADQHGKLAAQVKKVSDKGLPPVHLWNPEFSGDIDIRIARNGDWFYQESIFTRLKLVRLFSTVLRKDEDDYYLVTPVEKWRIKVDDAPFVITQIDAETINGQACLIAETNTGERVSLDKDHPLWVEINDGNAEPSPYIRVRDRLDGLVARSVYYQLVEHAEERLIDGKVCVGVESLGQFFSLGTLDEPL
ncbi:MAG: DUF1285 domain-containing protein [Motiliproteus sp.]